MSREKDIKFGQFYLKKETNRFTLVSFFCLKSEVYIMGCWQCSPTKIWVVRKGNCDPCNLKGRVEQQERLLLSGRRILTYDIEDPSNQDNQDNKLTASLPKRSDQETCCHCYCCYCCSWWWGGGWGWWWWWASSSSPPPPSSSSSTSTSSSSSLSSLLWLPYKINPHPLPPHKQNNYKNICNVVIIAKIIGGCLEYLGLILV